ncbi:hypothetical protein D9619_008235 [Psilocybe cf. subviscida]|uniref:NACHT domain-containing protein n=1 Tax=Psilocybe cf. subviscida TaxID=2480587 RepID=A0A8H5ESL2_9AGAR|nr:hypothetical protein D9619_008235 [Psilocybe cf. subviscida]
MSFFSNASKAVVTGGTFTSNSLANGGTLVQKSDSVVINNYHSSKGVHPNFLAAVAPNAFQNAVGQLLSRCFPGTRLKVIADIENWINSTGGSENQAHIAWLTGPAGCGKSAIVQTISERCSDQQIPVANFFFLRDDTTRNHIQPLIASLAYQLAGSSGFPGAKDRANQIIDADPLIFSQHIEKQFSNLIIALVRDVPLGKPAVLLIDGLDECISEGDQQVLIRTMHALAAKQIPGFPLKVLFASRPEAHLTITFNTLLQSTSGLLKVSLFSKNHDDIRLFVSACFDDIKKTHRFGANLGPLENAITRIVSMSSGQFLYAAIVMQYIANSSSNPTERLGAMIAASQPYVIRPSPQQIDNAFTRIDAIFAQVLSRCAESDWVKLSNILAAQIILDAVGDVNYNLEDCLAPLGTVAASADPLISRFRSIMEYSDDKKRLLFHHISLFDFLLYKARAQNHHIDINSFAAKLVGRILQKTDITKRPSTFKFMSLVLRRAVLEPTSDLTSALRNCPSITYALYDKNDPDLHQSFFSILTSIRTLYSSREEDVYESLLRIWLKWSLPHLRSHLNIITQRYNITPPPEIRRMIQENGQKRSMTDPLRLFSNLFWPGDYDNKSAETAHRAYWDSKDVATLNSAIKNYELAIEQYRKHQDESLVITLAVYAFIVWHHYQDYGQSSDDLDKVIRLSTEAWDSWDGEKNTDIYLRLLLTLARAHYEQYMRAFGSNPIKPDEKKKAFNKAVMYYTELTDNPADRGRGSTQSELGTMFLRKCELEQTLDYFEIGVQHLQDALSEAVKAGKEIDAGDEGNAVRQREKAILDSVKADCLLNLGNFYSIRYGLVEHSRKIPSLNMAIDYYLRAKPLLEALGQQTLPSCLYKLGTHLHLRWQWTGVRSDHILAKEMAAAARNCVGDDDPTKQAINHLKNILDKARP